MTDKQRLKTIKVILFILDHPEHVDQGGKTQTLINRTKNYKNINENSMSDERIFAISGQDIYECGYQWSCGTLAKAFYYVNSNLLNILQKMPEEKKGVLEQEVGSLKDVEPLEEVKIMISIHPDHLIDAMSAHTLPCIKMDDGKWHAIEPNIEYTVDEYKSCPIIPDEVRVGNKIHHILELILKEGGKPYEITKIMTGA